MRNYLYLIILLIVIALIVYIYIDTTNYRITKYELTSSKINNDIHFAFMSDLHECSYGNNNDLVLNDIKALSPEFIILAGDMFTSTKSSHHSFDKTINFMGELTKICPVYYGLGNHEERMRFKEYEYEDKFNYIYDNVKNAGVNILDNESVIVDLNNNKLKISGLSIEMLYYKKVLKRKMPDNYIESLLNKSEDSINSESPKSDYSILIAHNPEYFDNYAEYGSDLVLSGHNHGGIACLPYLGGVIAPSYKLFPKYDFGIFNEADTTMILSRGMGGHTIPLRFNNRPEIIDITIKGTK